MRHYYFIFKVFDFTFADGPTERVKLDPEKDPSFYYSRWATREEVVKELLHGVSVGGPAANSFASINP